MRIAEIYKSLQGEGSLTGTPSVLVRTSGCNLRCWWCDTPFASWYPEGSDQSLEEIVSRVLAYECRHVILTGGEPMIWAELIPLSQQLRAAGLHVTVETAGTLYLPVECDLMSISPKRANSTPPVEKEPRWAERHSRSRHNAKVIRRLVGEYDYQLKFVIGSPADCDDVQSYLREFPEIERQRVWMMPQGIEPVELAEIGGWLEPYCRQESLRFCPRRHIEWFGVARGT